MTLPLCFSVGSNCVLVDDDRLEGYPTFTNIEESVPPALLAAKGEDIDVRRRHAPAGRTTSYGQRADRLRVASVLSLQRQPHRRQPRAGRT